MICKCRCGCMPHLKKEFSGGFKNYYYICPACDNWTGFYDNKEAARKDWNKRRPTIFKILKCILLGHKSYVLAFSEDYNSTRYICSRCGKTK